MLGQPGRMAGRFKRSCILMADSHCCIVETNTAG